MWKTMGNQSCVDLFAWEPMSFPQLLCMQQFNPVWNDAHPQQLMFQDGELWSLSQMMSFQQQKRVKNGTKTARHSWGLSLCQNLGRSSCCAHGSFMTFDGATHVIFFQLPFLVVLMAFNGKIHHCFSGEIIYFYGTLRHWHWHAKSPFDAWYPTGK
jgi:hypothetical protein